MSKPFSERMEEEINSWSGDETITVAKDTLRAILHECTVSVLAHRYFNLNGDVWDEDDFAWQRDIIIYGLKAANTPCDTRQTLTLTINELRDMLHGNNLGLLLTLRDTDCDISYQEAVETFISKAQSKHHNNPASDGGSESEVLAWHARR